jgi:vancomycin resistance protein VanJ
MQNSSTRPGRIAARFILFLCLLYLVGLAAAATLLWTLADRWWPATALSFAPLWTLATPLILLIPLALFRHRRSLITLAVAGTVLVGPILQLQFNWPAPQDDGHASSLRVMTCNIHRRQLNADEFEAVLDNLHPDVVAMQDCMSADQSTLFPPETWNTRRDGELFLASRFPIIQAQPIALNEPPPAHFIVRLGAAAYYRLLTPHGEVSLINLHLSSPHAALEALEKLDPTSPEQLAYNSRCRESESASIEQFAENLNGPVLMMGDFNTPKESTIYRQHWDQFTNAFSAVGFGFGTTHSSTISSVRIDHILYSPGWQAHACWLAPAVGSPHRPLVADLQQSSNLPFPDSSADTGRN